MNIREVADEHPELLSAILAASSGPLGGADGSCIAAAGLSGFRVEQQLAPARSACRHIRRKHGLRGDQDGTRQRLAVDRQHAA